MGLDMGMERREIQDPMRWWKMGWGGFVPLDLMDREVSESEGRGWGPIEQVSLFPRD